MKALKCIFFLRTVVSVNESCCYSSSLEVQGKKWKTVSEIRVRCLNNLSCLGQGFIKTLFIQDTFVMFFDLKLVELRHSFFPPFLRRSHSTDSYTSAAALHWRGEHLKSVFISSASFCAEHLFVTAGSCAVLHKLLRLLLQDGLEICPACGQRDSSNCTVGLVPLPYVWSGSFTHCPPNPLYLAFIGNVLARTSGNIWHREHSLSFLLFWSTTLLSALLSPECS